MTTAEREVDPAPRRAPVGRTLLTTTEAARLLGVSRQTIVGLCEAGDLPYTQVGTHRRLDPETVRALRERTRRRPASARRSLWLAHAVAGALVQDPERVLAVGRDSLRAMLAASPRGRSREWLLRWERLLQGSVDAVLQVLTGPTVDDDEMRQHSPLTAALDPEQRRAVLDAFGRATAGRGSRRPGPAGPAMGAGV